ncbi:hypothetical protein DBR06_SOUSAS11710041, partial [Sousa chinensis]
RGAQERGGLSRIPGPGRGRELSGSRATGAALQGPRGRGCAAANPPRGRGPSRGRAEAVKGFMKEKEAKGGVYLDLRQKSQGLRDPPQSDFKRKGKHQTCDGDVWIYWGRRPG